MMDSKKTFYCKLCNKCFKSELQKNNHERKQICLPKHKRTYCAICDISFNTINELKFHNIDIDHITKLNALKPDRIKINNHIYNADPYLNEEDIKLMDKSIIGDNLTIIYKDNTVSKLSTEDSKDKINEESKDENIIKYQTQNNKIDYQEIIEKEIFNKPNITLRQQKILKYLSLHQSNNANIIIQKFKLILSKINLDDADFFASHLRESNIIDLKFKQLLGKYLDLFINALISKYNDGQELYNNMNIIEFVTKLTK